MNRQEALDLIKENVKGEFLIKHMLATGAIMKEIAGYLNENEVLWELTGLLHDIDFESTKDNPKEHGLKAEEILGDINEEIIRAIKAHNFEHTQIEPQTSMEKCLISSDAITGLIVAAALVKGKKLSAVTAETIKKCFKKKGFAAGSNRENIKKCEEFGVTLEKFFELSLSAMQKISEDLGL